MQRIANMRSIMDEFATSTGLSGTSGEPRRYLWADAFAVCNYLELYRQTDEQNFLQLALKLVDQVHQTLAKYRKKGVQTGWLSGLDEEQARLHPTLGGVRIGKRLDERQPGEAVNESLEWDQDGQYFHYLTKWMHALNCLTRDTGNGMYNQWAIELAKVAHAAFTYTPTAGGKKRMYWKMSIDLSRPLVLSMGQHDPLDGLITYHQLQATGNRYTKTPKDLSLTTEIEEMAAICTGRSWATEDALGIGGLLTDAYKLVQLFDTQPLHETIGLESLLSDIELSLRTFAAHHQLNLSADYRLAFRELGLAIGVQAISKMQKCIEQHPENYIQPTRLNFLLTKLSRFQSIHEFIESFWLEANHRSSQNWLEHADINNVMLATTLAPAGYFEL